MECLAPCKKETMEFADKSLRDKSIGKLYFEKAKLNGKEVLLLRDSGSSVIGVRNSLVKQADRITGTYKLKLIDGTVREYPMACVYIESAYITGKYVVACFEDPVADLIIGNIEGKHQSQSVGAAVTRSMRKKENESNKINNSEVMEDCCRVFSSCDEFLLDQINDPDLQGLWNRQLENSIDNKKNGSVRFQTIDRLLYRIFKGQYGQEEKQLVVPSSRREIILRTAHENMFAGHYSIRRTKAKIYKYFYWEKLNKDVKEFIQSCDICQRSRTPRRCDRIELGNMETITATFYKVAIDILGPLEMTENKNRFILTLVDVATRWPEAIPLRDTSTETVIEALTTIFSRIGLPHEILSDNGPQFTSKLYKQVCDFFNIKIVHSTPYHPSSNGMVERFNGSLKAFLRKVSQDDIKNWDRKVSAALFAYREVPNQTTGISPFQMVYGRQMRGPLAILKQTFVNKEEEEEYKNVYAYLMDLKQRLSEVTEIANRNSKINKNKYKTQYDRYSTTRKLDEGDCVLVLKPYRENKLSVYWQGPYRVNKKISKFNYLIERGDKVKIYHINRLMKYHSRIKDGNYKDETKVEETNTLQSANMVSVIDEEDEVEEGMLEDDIVPGIPTLDIKSRIIEEDIFKQIKVNPHLNERQNSEIMNVLNGFKDIISDIPGKATVEEFKIKITDTKPIVLKPYAVPMNMKDKVQQEIDSMLKLDIIGPTDSPYGAPVVIIRKKDGSLRPCVDYRKLNNVTEVPAANIPDQEELINQLYKAKYFTLIDLTKGYWQIPISEESKPYTAFRVLGNHYTFNYLPFGLKGAPIFFHKVLTSMLKDIDNVLWYFDDICVFSENWDTHVRDICNVFTVLKDHGFTIKPSKLKVGFNSIKFLGHNIGDGKVKPDSRNIEKILELKPPSTKKEVRSLIGLINYYSKFIPRYAELVYPFTELLKKGKSVKINWSDNCVVALKRIQDYLCKYPILSLPNMSLDYFLNTDASKKAISGILCQMEDGILHPVKFVSRKLMPREQKYSVIELEGLAIVWSIRKFDRYLTGVKFHLQTDHRALTYLNSSNFTNNRITRWALTLQNYDFDVTHTRRK